jgi:Cys-tRNA(Pro)/Cys-tRNA(Cys) deacylase
LDESITLESFLKATKLWYRFVDKPETIHTADAATVTGIPLQKITKNLVSRTDRGEYVLLVVPGDRRVDIKKAARVLGVKNVSTIPFQRAESISGYPPGGTPTVGHKTRMRTVIDKSLLDYETIFCGGGSRNKLLKLRVRDILDLSGALVAEISEAPSKPTESES